jgi:hypothetical protein
MASGCHQATHGGIIPVLINMDPQEYMENTLAPKRINLAERENFNTE